MSFKPFILPDAPSGNEAAVDSPETYNNRNAVIRQGAGLTAGYGVLMQSSPNGPIFRVRSMPLCGIAVTILFGSPTATQGEYMGNIMDGQATGMPPAGMTVGQACVIENLLDASLSGIWPVTAGTYGIGRIAGSTTIAGTSYPVIHTQTPPPEDCT